MSERPQVSVVVAVKDGERYLSESIESVRAQTYRDWELIVVDGDSADRSAEIASSYDDVICLTQDNDDGLAGAWNQGIGSSGGELIAFLDSDDRWLPRKLEIQMQLLAGDPGLAGAIGHVRFFRDPGTPPPPGFREELLDSAHAAHMPGALLVRRAVVDRIGRFDPAFTIATDIDWFARLKDSGARIGLVEEPVIEKRVHPENLSHSDPGVYQRGLIRSLRESIRRQEELR